MISPRSCAIPLALAGGLLAVAANAEQASGFTVVPSIGYHMFDSDTHLGNDHYGSLGLGYTFTSHWGLEFAYQQGSAELINTTQKIDLKQVRLDALYHFSRDGQVQPYLLIGGGSERWQDGLIAAENSLVNVGAGLKIWFSDSVSLRTDMRIINDPDNEQTRFAASLGLNVLVGGSRPVAASAASVDSDDHGVSDSEDRCPNTATSIEVDRQGCDIVLDDDQDGIPNAMDDCPDTSSGAKVDEFGCYVMIRETKEVSLRVEFESNSSNVTPNSRPEIERIARFMREYPLTEIKIEGHTDDTGEAAYNQWLSQQRANAVVKVLTEQYGIDASRVSATGYGQSRPIVVNNGEENRAKNRRVTAKITAHVERIAAP